MPIHTLRNHSGHFCFHNHDNTVVHHNDEDDEEENREDCITIEGGVALSSYMVAK